jgi:hypothetical protein
MHRYRRATFPQSCKATLIHPGGREDPVLIIFMYIDFLKNCKLNLFLVN